MVENCESCIVSNTSSSVKIKSKYDVILALSALRDNEYMSKVEMFHCAACKVYLSISAASVEKHLKSQEHLRSKKVTLVTGLHVSQHNISEAKFRLNMDRIKYFDGMKIHQICEAAVHIRLSNHSVSASLCFHYLFVIIIKKIIFS